MSLNAGTHLGAYEILSADCLARKQPQSVAVPDVHNMEPFVRQLRAIG